MPELPEVETVKRILEPQLVGRNITEVTMNRPDIVAHPLSDAFAAAATGATITAMDRRGKYLTILLADGSRIILHLRMTGSLLVTPPDHPEEKHTHIVFQLSDGNELRFVDPRRFGRFWLFRKGEEDTICGMHKLGPEPFDAMLNADHLSCMLSKRKRAIKDCLLDQTVMAGIGNIYADESLFAAKIRPDRAASTLTDEEWHRLAAVIPTVLRQAVEANAMTPEEYVAGNGRQYRNTPTFQVYGHGGEPCPCCGATLLRTVVAGRGTVYCPVCQESSC